MAAAEKPERKLGCSTPAPEPRQGRGASHQPTALPGMQKQQRPSVLPRALDLDVKHGMGRSRDPQ